jgi:hypothetical protein
VNHRRRQTGWLGVTKYPAIHFWTDVNDSHAT